MTDAEIIKALECCGDINDKCHYCPLKDKGRESCVGILMSNAADLIKRQQAEIEHLNGVVTTTAECAYESRQMAMKWARAKAIKEFAERLKGELTEILTWYEVGNFEYPAYNPNKMHNVINNLVKEMVGETE